MIRVARTRAGEVFLDPPAGGSKGPGRGAYVCPTEGCVERALAGGFRKMLKYEGSLPGDLRERLLERIRPPRGRR
jgi:predicted RNA-binding protein YlxR (DUF448 family)